MLCHAGQRVVLRGPVVEEKEAGERRLRLARQQLAQQADQLSVALLLGGPPRHAGDLEGVRVVAQHQQLVPAAKRHAGGHVEVPAHVAAGVVGVVLFLVNLQQDVAPRHWQSKVREGVGRLRFQPAAAEGQVVLVLEGDLCIAERLVHLKLLTPGHCARVVAVPLLHVLSQKVGRPKSLSLLRTPLDFTYEVLAKRAITFLSVMLADTGATACLAQCPSDVVRAERAAIALSTLALVLIVRAESAASALTAEIRQEAMRTA